MHAGAAAHQLSVSSGDSLAPSSIDATGKMLQLQSMAGGKG